MRICGHFLEDRTGLKVSFRPQTQSEEVIPVID